MQSNYRLDIDGLRALAVVPVVWRRLLGGGEAPAFLCAFRAEDIPPVVAAAVGTVGGAAVGSAGSCCDW